MYQQLIFLLLSTIPLNEYTKSDYVLPCAWALGYFFMWSIINKKKLESYFYKQFWEHTFSFLLNNFLGGKFWGHWGGEILTL